MKKRLRKKKAKLYGDAFAAILKEYIKQNPVGEVSYFKGLPIYWEFWGSYRSDAFVREEDIDRDPDNHRLKANRRARE